MAGYRLKVNLPPTKVAKIVRETAEENGYLIDEIDLFDFRVQKGSFAISLIAGAFIAYCDFAVEVEEDDRKPDNSVVVLRRNTPWWTGLIGISRVTSRAKELVQEISEELEEAGANVSDLKDIK